MSSLVYVNKPGIKPDSIEQREYQVNIAQSAMHANTLVVLPTGLGKTVIALIVIAEMLQKEGKILFLAPTKPLVLQHAQFLKTYLTIEESSIVVFTGETSPAKRKLIWENSRIIVSTPQVIENDLIAQQLDLKNVSFVIFDEVHRAAGNYSYVFVAEMYQKQRTEPLVIGMTASPGNDISKILEICKNLQIKNIEIRTKYDHDVRPYVHEINIQWKEIVLPHEFSKVLQLLRKALSARLTKLKEIGVIDSAALAYVNRTKLLDMQKAIQTALREQPNPPKELYTAASAQNAALKLYHAVELLQTQGVSVLKSYFLRLETEAFSKGGSKASRDIMHDPDVLEAIAYTKSLTVEHPKIPEIIRIVIDQLTKKPDSKIIVFTHYRDTSAYVVKQLEKTNHAFIRAVRFIGQAEKGDDKGLNQKQQAEIIQQFKDGFFNVLVATSVAEEGLDIPSTDLVVFFEPVPSEIRTIQRRGRTGRKMTGNVIFLIAKGTPDEGYYWSAKRKEKQMRSELEILRSSLKKEVTTGVSLYEKPLVVKEDQKTLEQCTEKKTVKIIVDQREFRSPVARFLSSKNIKVESVQLDVGDYILSSRIGVERKTVDDFLESMISGHLFAQVKRLREAYSRPILIIEGEKLLTKRNISHNAIFGCFVSIIVDFGIPIITTSNEQETADFLSVMAAREQREEKKEVAIRGKKWVMSLKENQQFLLEGLPNVSAVLAKRLLDHFGSIRSIVNASEEELTQVPGIGKKTASDIIALFNAEYIKE